MQELDLKGLKCPLPVMRLRKFLRDHLEIGHQVKVETTDPLASLDIPHYCRQNNQKLVSSISFNNGNIFIIEKQNQAMSNR